MVDDVLPLELVKGDLPAELVGVRRVCAEEDLEAVEDLVDAPDLAVRPARDAVLAADLLEHRGADAQRLGHLGDRQVKVLAQELFGVSFLMCYDHFLKKIYRNVFIEFSSKKRNFDVRGY